MTVLGAARFRAGKRLWNRAEISFLVKRYPHEPTATTARALRRSVGAVYQRAQMLGLTKSAEYLASPAACRLRRGDNVGAAFRFKKGQVPANKGLRRPGWGPGRMKETQFKKGERRGVAARNWRPVGTILTDPDGYFRIKVREAQSGEAYGFGNGRVWPLLQRHVWEQAHGPIPPGHAVVFKNGDKTDVRLANLELLTRRELMARNTVHNLPKPLAETIQLLGALNRKIRRRTKAHEEQDRGPSQPPVRDAGGAEGRREADGSRSSSSDRGRRARGRRLREGRGRLPQGDRRDSKHRIPSRGAGGGNRQAEAEAHRRRRRPLNLPCDSAADEEAR